MRGSSDDHLRYGARPERSSQGGALAVTAAPLVQFSTWVPPQPRKRLRVAAPQVDRREGESAAAAIDRFRTEYGL